MTVQIAGVASTQFGEHPDSSARELFTDAALEALEDASLPPGDVEELYAGNFIGDLVDDQAHVGAMLADYVGARRAASMRTESACASASSAARCGVQAIAAGDADVALVGGVELMHASGIQEVTDALANAADNEYENAAGLTFPGIYALMAQVYMNEFDVGNEELAAVAVKNYENGTTNPIAQRQEETDVESVLESPPVAAPLHLQDCCPVTDGASAAVLVSETYAEDRGLETEVSVAGTGQASDSLALQDRPDLARTRAAERAAEDAYDRAGVSPEDVDVVELHDCFTIAEILAVESLGFFERGEGARGAVDGETAVGGRIPVNTSGGLLAKGHPVGATGVAQIVEITKQLEGRHPNQVADPRTGLTHTVGGSGASCVVTVLEGGA
ncbi:thiolase domain-containing protein [Natronobacterium gregoryi]|uniref:propanoyl-CoA C-acyltransferase n=2 Tax=Natronobacterium gregoryi TaxID=44930 RepID=L0ACW5_NATGS|nr:thiolase domain-containing protein [Natronobacterium gregoryi]AFZ71681.1 acetyl-CoA acetyltransferase [Natronobacterium gregoryi SP2]ELY72747.1 acetyl-CoA C-acetyltransferase [Natronobacterium gregoryi SP2]PLK20271.1 3-ketoacyl-CoA thiolase [Natronobacterium gregoryi SP2]SFJ24929.1 acetyl-CoA C-acetyltransferase/acetyl-CoA acyltransferase [Natronobacterium gregoryi]